MKISVAQTRPIAGDVLRNIERHLQFIEIAAANSADVIIFPELSLTGYEPKLAKELATTTEDRKFDIFQKASDAHQITIGAGMPLKGEAGILIGMLIFQPGKPRQTYCKQRLHSDELPYFVEGRHECFLEVKGEKIAPAICYESLLPEHSEKAVKNGATMYVASVAKSARGIEKAMMHYPMIARKYSIPVLMSNCLGLCDDFDAGGKTALWNSNGELVEQLVSQEGILILDTQSLRSQVIML